jgi:peroxiredoxin
VLDIKGKPLKRSLRGLAGGDVKIVLYFWSAALPTSCDELERLSGFQRARSQDAKVIAVAFPVGGDEKNAKSKTWARSNSGLGLTFVFDNGKDLYTSYRPDTSKSDVKSTFVIDADGMITSMRVGRDRSNDLVAWLTEAVPTPPSGGWDIPRDAVGRPFEREVGMVVGLHYISPRNPDRFDCGGTVTASEFMSAVAAAARANGMDLARLDKPDDPASRKPITREQALKLLVYSLVDEDERKRVSVLWGCGTGDDAASLYLSDFRDLVQVDAWALQPVGVAVYMGWVPTGGLLRPREFVRREYVAALLARAFPDQRKFSGMLVRLPKSVRDSQGLRIVSEGSADPKDRIYPPAQYAAPGSYLTAPGIISWCTPDGSGVDIDCREVSGQMSKITVPVAAARRIGAKPLVVDAIDVREPGKDNPNQAVLEIVVSKKAAEAIRRADEGDPSDPPDSVNGGLFLRRCRVAVMRPAPISATKLDEPAQPRQLEPNPEGTDSRKLVQ